MSSSDDVVPVACLNRFVDEAGWHPYPDPRQLTSAQPGVCPHADRPNGIGDLQVQLRARVDGTRIVKFALEFVDLMRLPVHLFSGSRLHRSLSEFRCGKNLEQVEDNGDGTETEFLEIESQVTALL